MANRLKTSLTLAFPLLLAACGGSSGGGTTVNDIEIPVVARANDTVIDCDAQLTGLGTDFASGEIRGFALYVHDVVLLASDGSEMPLTLAENDWQSEGVALLDFQNKLDTCASDTDKPTNKVLQGSVAGNLSDVSGIRFRIGVPAAMNHGDTAAANTPLNRSDLFWSWQTGYKFMRFDVAPQGGVLKPDASSAETWNFHLGSTGCTGNPQTGETVSCSSENRPLIELDVSDIANQQLVINYAKLIENNALLSDQGGAVGCMSGPTDPECAAVFDALGMGIAGNDDPTPGQTVFSVETVE